MYNTYFRADGCREPAQIPDTQGSLNSSCIRNPFYTSNPFCTCHSLSQASRLSLQPELFLQELHETLTLSSHVPDKTLPFSHMWTFLLSCYLQKYHFGLCIQHPNILHSKMKRVLLYRETSRASVKKMNWKISLLWYEKKILESMHHFFP